MFSQRNISTTTIDRRRRWRRPCRGPANIRVSENIRDVTLVCGACINKNFLLFLHKISAVVNNDMFKSVRLKLIVVNIWVLRSTAPSAAPAQRPAGAAAPSGVTRSNSFDSTSARFHPITNNSSADNDNRSYQDHRYGNNTTVLPKQQIKITKSLFKNSSLFYFYSVVVLYLDGYLSHSWVNVRMTSSHLD